MTVCSASANHNAFVLIGIAFLLFFSRLGFWQLLEPWYWCYGWAAHIIVRRTLLNAWLSSVDSHFAQVDFPVWQVAHFMIHLFTFHTQNLNWVVWFLIRCVLSYCANKISVHFVSASHVWRLFRQVFLLSLCVFRIDFIFMCRKSLLFSQ
jgi:hypothetical protein